MAAEHEEAVQEAEVARPGGRTAAGFAPGLAVDPVHAGVLALQRSAGNRAFGAVLARTPGKGSTETAAPKPKKPRAPRTPKARANLDTDLGTPPAIQDLRASPKTPMDPQLVEHARQWRLKKTNLDPDSFRLNVAVVKYSRDGVIDYAVSANDPSKLHSEDIVIKELEAADPRWERTKILEVYSERQPCYGCKGTLARLRAKLGIDFPTFYTVGQWEPRNSRAGQLATRYLRGAAARLTGKAGPPPLRPATERVPSNPDVPTAQPKPVSAAPATVDTPAATPAGPDVPAPKPVVDAPAAADVPSPKPVVDAPAPQAAIDATAPKPAVDVPAPKPVVDAPAPTADVHARPTPKLRGVGGAFAVLDVVGVASMARDMRMAEQGYAGRSGVAVLQDEGGEYTLRVEDGWFDDDYFKVYISGPRTGEVVEIGWFEWIGEIRKRNRKYGYFDIFGEFVPGEVPPIIIDPLAGPTA